jgi:ribonuclease HI
MASTNFEDRDALRFYCWVWDNLEDIASSRGRHALSERAIAERTLRDYAIVQYRLETGERAPEETSEEREMRELCESFDDELSRGEVPRLVEHVAYESQEVPAGLYVTKLAEAMTTYYPGEDYPGEDALQLFAADADKRAAARLNDEHWSERLEVCFAWRHRLPVEMPEVTGTTNERQIAALKESYAILSFIQPGETYPIVAEDGCFVYSGTTPTHSTDEGFWMGVRAAIARMHVVGPFAYDSREEATRAQQKRLRAPPLPRTPPIEQARSVAEIAKPLTVAYADGSCVGKKAKEGGQVQTGKGGWAWATSELHYASGAEVDTTNQRMELRAATEPILAIAGPLKVVTDSAYVVNCFKEGWWRAWRKNGWRSSKGAAVANRDLWEPLIELVVDKRAGEVTLEWVKGHSTCEGNILADKLARKAAETQRGAASSVG